MKYNDILVFITVTHWTINTYFNAFQLVSDHIATTLQYLQRYSYIFTSYI